MPIDLVTRLGSSLGSALWPRLFEEPPPAVCRVCTTPIGGSDPYVPLHGGLRSHVDCARARFDRHAVSREARGGLVRHAA